MDLSYGYANARIKGMKSKLLDEETLRGLCSALTFNEFVNMMESTAYKQSFVNASAHNEGIKLVMAGLRIEFDGVLSRIAKVVPDESQDEVQSLISLYELKPFQLILAAKAASLPIDQSYIGFLDARGKEKAQVLIDAPNFGEALLALGKVGYSKLASKVSAKYIHSKDFRTALRIIGKEYYSNIWEYARGESDPLIKQILTAELDYFNCSTALRLKNAGLKYADIRPELSHPSAGGLALQIARSETVQSAVEAVAGKFGKREIMENYSRSKSIPEVELELEKRMYSKILSATRVSVMTLGGVIGFIYLKRREIENLRAIAVSLTFPKRDAMMCKSIYTLKGEIGAKV